MPSAELTSTKAPQQLAASLDTSHPRSPQTGRAAFHAIVLWLLRVLTDSAGAWALAAGAPLDHSNAEAMAGGMVTAINPTGTEGQGRGRR